MCFIRDRQLDHYRALMMMHVIIAHVMYWLCDVGEPWLSFILFAMAGTFFIAGASVAVAGHRRGLWATVLNRLWRVAMPFYIYAVVIIAFGIVMTALVGDTRSLGFKPLDIGDYGWEEVLQILLCQDVPGAPYHAHLWFLQPYLILSCTFPLQVKAIGRCNRHVYMAACVGLFLVVQAVTRHELLREVACYNVFMVAGYLYYRRAGVLPRVALCLCVAAAIVVHVATGGNFCPMQSHKFPPDWVFAAYGAFALSAVSLLLGRFEIPASRFLGVWNKRGFNIYLYQSLVFVGVFAIRYRTYMSLSSPLALLLIDSVLAILLATALSMLTYPIERAVMRLLGEKAKRH